MTFVYVVLWRFAKWRADRGVARSVYWASKERKWDKLAHPKSVSQETIDGSQEG